VGDSDEIEVEGDVSCSAEEIGAGDSCAAAGQIDAKAIKSAKLARFVISDRSGGVFGYRKIGERMSRNSSQPSHKATAGQATSLGMTSGLSIVPPIDVREQVVAPFAIAQKLVIDVVGDKLIV
jgi:hypothetical protein